MTRALVLGLLTAAALSGAPAHAAPSTCTAVSPGPRATCSYQSSGGTSDATCLASYCYVTYGSQWFSLSFGERQLFWTSYADVVRVSAYGGGAATAGDSRFDQP